MNNKSMKNCKCDCHEDDGVYLHTIDHSQGMCCRSPFRKRRKIGWMGTSNDPMSDHDY